MSCKSACEVSKDRPGEKTCRSCALGMLISWYVEELEKTEPAMAKELQAVVYADGATPHKMCKAMDHIRSRTSEDTKKRLCMFNKTFDMNVTETGGGE